MNTSSEPCFPVEILPALAELAGAIWREHYPHIISREQIEHMPGRMYALETLRTELRERQVQFYRRLVAVRLSRPPDRRRFDFTPVRVASPDQATVGRKHNPL
jgi:hypothetical protein